MGTTPRTFPKLDEATVAELIELLDSPNAVARFHGQGELLNRGKAVVAELTRVCRSSDFLLDSRVAAIFAVKQIQGTNSHELLKSLTADVSVREFAIRALTDRKSQRNGLDANFFAPFLADDSPRVQAQALIALGRIGDASVANHSARQ